MGLDYAVLALEKTDEGFRLSENECHKADKGKPEVENASVMIPDSTAYLRVKMADGVCNFSYSLDGKKFKNIGKPFTARAGNGLVRKSEHSAHVPRLPMTAAAPISTGSV